MAVKQQAEVTLTDYSDASSIVCWYKISTSATLPSAPTTTQTSQTVSGWQKTEPTIASDADAAKYVYSCWQTNWGDGSCEWGDVSMSASFEAAKRAWNKASAVQTSIDNLEIGGRNLLYDTADWANWSLTGNATVADGVLTVTNTSTGTFRRANGWFTCPKADVYDEVVVISFDVKKTSSTDLSTLNFQLFTTNKAYKSVNVGNITEGSRYYTNLTNTVWNNTSEVNDATWTRVYSNPIVMSEVFNTSYTEYEYLAAYIGISAALGSASFRNLKVERGNVATDWTPAPEDIQAEALDSEQQIYIQASSVSDAPTVPSAWVEESGESVSDDEALRSNLLRNTDSFAIGDWALNSTANMSCPEPGTLKYSYVNAARYAKYKVDYLDFENYGEGDFTYSFEAKYEDDGTGGSSKILSTYIGFSTASRTNSYFSSSYDRFSENSSFTLTEDWTQYTVTKTFPTDLTRGKAEALVAGSNLSVDFDRSATGYTMYIRNIKIARGSAITGPSWTTKQPIYRKTHPVTFVATQRKRLDGTVTCTAPLPDDTNTVIDGGRIITHSIQAHSLESNSLKLSNFSTEVTDKFGSYDQAVGDVGTLSGNVESLSNKVATFEAVEHMVSSHDGQLTTIMNSLKFNEGELELKTQSGSESTSVALTSTKLAFRSGNSEVASISNEKLDIQNAEVHGTLAFGGFAFIPRSNGNLSLKWIGA